MKIVTMRYSEAQGWSEDFDTSLDSDNTLILVFASPDFLNIPEPIKILASHFPRSKMIGCSTSGEIFGAFVFDHSLSVAIVYFEKTVLRLSLISIENPDDSFQAGEEIAKQLNASDLASIFVLSEGVNVNGSELVKGLNTISKKEVVITGGLAGDGDRFQKTFVIQNGHLFTKKIVAVGFYGDHVHVGHGSKGGWDIFGTQRRITRSKKNVLYELDGQSALSLYKTYLGEKAAGLPATGLLYPLAIRKNLDDPKQLVRTILSIDEKEGALIFAGDMPMGYLAQLMRANFDRIVHGAKNAGELVLESDNALKKEDKDILLIAVSCVGRRLLLGERIEEETDSVLSLFPKRTTMVGFYSYGELSPYIKGQCDLHNQTMTLTSIHEDG